MNDIIDKKYQILSGSALKTIALISMLIDHIGLFILNFILAANRPLFTFFSNSVSLFDLFRLVGRVAFPLYCFLLVEGYVHTKDKKKYGRDLFLFALISEIPYNLVFASKLTYQRQNVFLTLFLGFLCMYFYELFNQQKIKQILSIFVLFVVARFSKIEYGILGVAFILFLYVVKDKRNAQYLLGPLFFENSIKIYFALLPILFYNGKRGFIKNKYLKYLYYAFYPLHLLVIYYIKHKMFR